MNAWGAIALVFSGLQVACYGTSLAGHADGSEDTSLPPDAASDPLPDATIDTMVDASPDPPVSICNIIEQTGCPDGTWCSWGFDDSTCTQYETCFTRTAGILAPGERCNSGGEPLCRPGTECFWNEPYPTGDDSRCHEWCRTDSDCTVDDGYCGLELEFTQLFGPCLGVVVTYPYRLCIYP